MQEVITPELLKKHLNLAYLNPEIQSALPSSLISVLGIHRLNSSDIVAVTKAIAKELAQSSDMCNDTYIEEIAKLLVCNFRSLEQEYGVSDHILEELKSVVIIPLANGKMVSLNSQAVFFPLGDSPPTEQGIQELYKDLSIVSPKMLACLDTLSNSQVNELLKKLGVHGLEPEKVLFEHILPILKDETWKGKPHDIVVSYDVFIKLHCPAQDLFRFKSHLPVLTNRGFIYPSSGTVHFSKEYKNIDLPTKLPGTDWVLLDPCYLRTDLDIEGWRTFFGAFGVQDLFIFSKEKRRFTKQELASSPWAPVYEIWPEPGDNIYLIEDNICEEFYSLITADSLSTDEKQAQRETLLSLLDRNWDTGYRISRYKAAQVFDSQGQKLKDVDSSFAVYLRTLPWLPASNLARDEPAYLCPNEVYLKSRNLFQLLDSHVHYVSIDLVSQSEFAASVGIKTSITPREMLKHFESWCTNSDTGSEEPEGAEFETSEEHIHAVYRYLSDNCNHNDLKSFFTQKPAVFVPNERKRNTWSGKFYHLKEVCWHDPTNMFQRYSILIRHTDEVQEPHVLAPFYKQWNETEQLFLMQLQVEKIPNMKQYVELLQLICSETPLPNSEVLQDVSVLYAVLAKKCKQSGEHDTGDRLNQRYCSTLKGMLKDKQVFPSKDNCWVSLEKHPLIPDNKQLEKVFKPHCQLCLLILPPAELRGQKVTQPSKSGVWCNGNDKNLLFREEDRALFLDICGVKKLSECITVEAQTESYRPCPSVQRFVHTIVPYIQKFIYFHEDFDYVYAELKKENIVEILRSLTFGMVSKLYTQYQLCLPSQEPLYERQDVVCLLKAKKEFYIQKDHVHSRTDICREIVKLFNAGNKDFGKELERFLQGLISVLEDAPALKRFLSKEDINELSDDEERWEDPKALELKPDTKVFQVLQNDEEHAYRVFKDSMEARGNEENTEDGGKTLASWPPRSALHGVSNTASDGVVNNVMRMWPPPAPPSESESRGSLWTTDKIERGGDAVAKSNKTCVQHFQEGDCRVTPFVPPVQGDGVPRPKYTEPEKTGLPTEVTTSDQQLPVQATISSTFKGNSCASKLPLPLDNPVWARETLHENMLEELSIHSEQIRQLVKFSEDNAGNTAVGEWGERLVGAFLSHWKESGCEPKLHSIIWNNQEGESGLPYDFKVSFLSDTGICSEVLIEVKSTVKSEKHLVQMSANEIDLALNKKDRYQIYRVYNAGDSQNVRLCRIKNLAQCLHAKQLELFLFI
ncbi:uncharacterized protein LOC102363940 [Latimeria chalumnae]|uniref:uncharacterized protein LOC102363940 n=1 Tax=Latimeria chalumnae TaxID=7897 RepID=UPI00313CD79B